MRKLGRDLNEVEMMEATSIPLRKLLRTAEGGFRMLEKDTILRG